jgi:hypothetical protein
VRDEAPKAKIEERQEHRPSRESPLTADERALLKDFELHATKCERCFNPIKVQFTGGQLCDEGCRYAHLILETLYEDDGCVYRKPMKGGRKSEVLFPAAYRHSEGLLVAMRIDSRQDGNFGALYCYRCGRRCRIGDCYALREHAQINCVECSR